MAQDVKLNLYLDGVIKTSDYSFLRQEQSTIYFRLIKNKYVADSSKFTKLEIDFKDSNNSSNAFPLTLLPSDIVEVDNESFVKMVLPTNMTNTSAEYIGFPKVTYEGKTSNLPSFSIVIYQEITAEMNFIRQVVSQYNDTFGTYANLIKNDLVGKFSGVASTDDNNKISENLIPNRFKEHTETKMVNKEIHKIRINKDGRLEYYSPAEGVWKLAQGQSGVAPPHVPPVITVKDSTVTVKHDNFTLLSSQKWAFGEISSTGYFATSGNKFTGSTFTVDKIGTYTLWYKTTNGKEYISFFEVVSTDLSILPPVITVKDGLAKVAHHANTAVVLQKWVEGSQNLSWFDTNGNITYNNQFSVTNTGIHTLFYQVADGRKFVMTFTVLNGELRPPDIMPTISVNQGLVTVTHDKTTDVAMQKYETGSHNIAYFQANGTDLIGKTFDVFESGIHTYYYKTTYGSEFALEFNIQEKDLPAHVPPKISIDNGIVTITHNVSTKYTIQKESLGSQSIAYFSLNGNTVVNNEFNVLVASMYTLYYKLIDGKEYIMTFNVEESQLEQPHITPTVGKKDGKFTINFSSSDRVEVRKWDVGIKDLDYFRLQGNGNSTSSNIVTVSNIGDYTYYYKLKNGNDYVINIAMDYQHMPQVSPTIAISLGEVVITHGQWMRLDVQKYASGSKNIGWFQSDGTVITNNKTLIDEEGSYTLYYKTAWGEEFVQTFIVTNSQIPNPHIPPVITIQYGVATISYNTGDVATLQKWSFGTRQKSFFETGGEEFAGNVFTVTLAGTHTLYYKLENGKDYVKTFIVQSNMLPVPFVHPIFTVSKGIVTVKNDGTTVLGQPQKWDKGLKDTAWFANNGNTLVDLKFTVTEADTYTVYSEIIDGRKFVTTVVITEIDLPIPRIDPVIGIVDNLATVNYASNIFPVLQKWELGVKEVGFFATGGSVISGFTFTVSELGTHTFYYKRDDNEEYVFQFEVTHAMLIMPQPTITVNGENIQVAYQPIVDLDVSKWDTGSRDISWFQTNGNNITNNTFTVTVAGVYTLYYKVKDGREFVMSFSVSQEDLTPHDKPTFVISDKNISVVVASDLEADTTDMKWAEGSLDIDGFNSGGNVVMNKQFTVSNYGIHTLYYKYKGRAYVKEFTILEPVEILSKYKVARFL